MTHLPFDSVEATNAVSLCGGWLGVGALVGAPADCPKCLAREAARRLGAFFARCGACGGRGSVGRWDSAATSCMNCGGEGVYQLWHGGGRRAP